MKKTLSILVAALLCLPGCRRGGAEGLVSREPGGLVRVSVDALSALDEPIRGFDLLDHFTPVGVLDIGVEPENYIEGGVHGWYVFDEESVLAYGFPRVLRLSVKDGSLLNEYGRKGRGPGEFLDAELCFVRDGKVYVSDEMSRVHVYDATDGHLLEEFPLTDTQVQLCMLSPLEKDLFVLGYSSLTDKDQRFDVVDKDLKPVRASGLRFDRKAIEKDRSIWTGYAGPFDGQTCIASGDTLYRITPKKEIPLLTFANPSRKEGGLSSRYMAGDLLFVQYNFPEVYTRTVLDVKRGAPLFYAQARLETREVQFDGRTVSTRVLNTGDGWGLPLTWEGEERQVWPVFSDRGLLICWDEQDRSRYYCLKRK